MGRTRLWSVVLGGALLAACASSRPSASKADVPTPPAAATEAAAAAAAPSTEAPRPLVPPPASGQFLGGLHSPGPFQPAGGLPLVAPGESRTESEGCLALAHPETDGATQAPAVENTRGGVPGGEPEVAVKSTPSGLVVTHGLFHNCCQKAQVDTKVEGEKVTITETFSGDVCRCNCRSTLRTVVGLKSGTYGVEVLRVEGGPPKSIFTGTATVQAMIVPRPR